MRGVTSFARGAVVALGLICLAPAAVACPVCFGEAEGDVLEGAELAVWFLVGVTYLLLVGGGVLVFALRRRALRAQGGSPGGPPGHLPLKGAMRR